MDKTSLVAIKILDKYKLDVDIGIDQIKAEIYIMQQQLDHPNIVPYFETYDDDKYLYLVMDYVKGMDLFEAIMREKKQKFSEKQAAKYMIQLFKAITHCHAQGVVHRGIKPENVVVTANEEIRLIDFSFAKVADSNNEDEEITGTPLYMAPEAIDGHNNKESDMWSLGVLLYTLVSGTFPFYEKKKYELYKQI